MSGICGWVGEVDADTGAAILDAMLGAIDYRGDRVDVAFAPGVALGYRWWGGRPGKSPGIHREGPEDRPQLVAAAGTLAPAVSSPAVTLLALLRKGVGGAEAPSGSVRGDLGSAGGDLGSAGGDLGFAGGGGGFAAGLDLDGAFAAAWWDGERRRLTLIRDPFGVRSLYMVSWGGVRWFASELKQLLAIPGLPVEPDPVAIHAYLTFSFVPGEAVPVKGVRRLLPGHVAVVEAPEPHGAAVAEARRPLGGAATSGPGWTTIPYFTLQERLESPPPDTRTAMRRVDELCRGAVLRRLNGEREVGVYLSGGLDSSAVALWLRDAGVGVRALSLDFGPHAGEREAAQAAARHLGVPLAAVPVAGEDIAAMLDDLVWKLDLPFGDPVTGPQYMLGRAARAMGLDAVFNGEGGDQLFGGWTAKPMIAAALYAPLTQGYGAPPGDGADASLEALYLKSYHRFYGLEEAVYSDAFRELVGPPGLRRGLLRPYLGEATGGLAFLNRVRLADLSLKGSQSILPRAERMANAWALDVRVPLFDRALAEASFALPPTMKLHGACEKWILKKALTPHLPHDLVWRRKQGMGVPITDWALGALAPRLGDLLGPEALARRGWFRPEYVAALRAGHGLPDETRRRRVGERLWALAMLEAWLRIFIDGRGARPS